MIIREMKMTVNDIMLKMEETGKTLKDKIFKYIRMFIRLLQKTQQQVKMLFK